jgi:hypothetical protein
MSKCKKSRKRGNKKFISKRTKYAKRWAAVASTAHVSHYGLTLSAKIAQMSSRPTISPLYLFTVISVIIFYATYRNKKPTKTMTKGQEGSLIGYFLSTLQLRCHSLVKFILNRVKPF